jgi:hypothetical protein
LWCSFATRERSGLLLYNGRFNQKHDFIALELVDEQVQLTFCTGKQALPTLTTGKQVPPTTTTGKQAPPTLTPGKQAPPIFTTGKQARPSNDR